MKRKSVTIKDVAQTAGVSRASAARVLGDYGYTSGPVRDAVMKAAADLNYAPSRMAKAMRNGRSQLIGFVSADITDGLFSEALGGICRVADPAGYQVVVFNSTDCLSNEIEGISSLLSHGVEGLIVSPVIVSHWGHLSEALQSVPTVCLDRVPAGMSGVLSDNERAGRQAASRLLQHGHRQIGLVASVQLEEPIEFATDDARIQVLGARRPSVLRVRGFVEYMQEAGRDIDISQICLNSHRAENTSDLVTSWLGEHPEITAILAADSYQARHVYRALRDKNKKVPDEVSVLVFSDDEWTEFVTPEIDTISLDGSEMGARAAETLFEDIAGRGGSAYQKTIPTTYRKGASIASLARPESS